MNAKLERVYKISLLVFAIWFLVGLVVVGFGLNNPFGPWADLAFIGFASIVLFLHSAAFLKWSGLIAVFLAYAIISGAAEAYGAATGKLFGTYTYSGNFGPLLFGLLPVAIPLAWWVVVWPLHCLVQSAVRGRWRYVLVPPVTAALAVWADLVIEPAATLVRGYWTWEEGGFYYGVPWTNFLGWFSIAFVLSLLSQPFLKFFSTGRVSLAVPTAVLSATLFTFLLLSLVHGKWLAVAVALGFFAVVGLLLRQASGRES